jgi:hypothetical protein
MCLVFARLRQGVERKAAEEVMDLDIGEAEIKLDQSVGKPWLLLGARQRLLLLVMRRIS